MNGFFGDFAHLRETNTEARELDDRIVENVAMLLEGE